jgi:hypothetical protein
MYLRATIPAVWPLLRGRIESRLAFPIAKRAVDGYRAVIRIESE